MKIFRKFSKIADANEQILATYILCQIGARKKLSYLNIHPPEMNAE